VRIAICATMLICGFVSAGRTPQIQPTAPHRQENPGVCGWIGVRVRPMTSAFAASLGMVEAYGAIFGQPEPGSPTANAGIQEGDVITAIDGTALSRSSDFDPIISAMPSGSLIYLTTYRNGQLIKPTVMLGSSACPTSE
jgi:serine protease Do